MLLQAANGSNWRSIWSLDSPFSPGRGLTPQTDGPARPQPPSSNQPPLGSSGQSSYLGNTYDLFESQGSSGSIWSSLHGEDNVSGFLPWGQPGSAQETKD